MPRTVESLRHKIDIIDDKLHDLLMERARLAIEIGEERRKSEMQAIQPDQDTVMIRRLLERHKGSLPKEAVARIWRELVGAVSLAQSGHNVAVSAPEGAAGSIYWDMAKDYFSSVLPMHKAANPLVALAQVREHETTFAVLPWPENDRQNPWWAYLLGETGDEGMRIMGRLPLGDSASEIPNPEHRALVVARLKYESSGADRSFLALDLDDDISRTRIIDKAKALNLSALSLYSCAGIRPGRKAHLLEVDGYVDPEGMEHLKLAHSFDDSEAKCICLGGYPVPPVYDDKTGRDAVAAKAAQQPMRKSA